jgi:hypothetical protein
MGVLFVEKPYYLEAIASRMNELLAAEALGLSFLRNVPAQGGLVSAVWLDSTGRGSLGRLLNGQCRVTVDRLD